MLKLKKNKIIIVLIIACCLLTIILGIVVKKFGHYQRINPPLTAPDKGVCTTSGLISHWKFDSLDNKITQDSSGNNNTGKVQYFFLHDDFFSKLFFGTPEVVEGPKGNALRFNAKNWISGGNKSCYNVDKFTIALWVWLDNYDNIPTIMAKSSFVGYDGWWLCTTNKTGFIDLGIAWGNGFTHVKSGYKLPLNEWHFLAVTVDNTKQKVQFYIDGAPYGKIHTDVPKWLINWNHDMFIAEYDGGGYWAWPGRLDDVRFYSEILSSEEVQSIYSSL